MAATDNLMFDISAGQVLTRMLATAVDESGMSRLRDHLETLPARLGGPMLDLLARAVASEPLGDLSYPEMLGYSVASPMLNSLLAGTVDSQRLTAMVDQLGQVSPSSPHAQVVDKVIDLLEQALAEAETMRRMNP